MKAKRVRLDLTEAEAKALFSLADSMMQNEEDAETVLATRRELNAGYRAISKLQEAMFERNDA